MTPHTLLCLPYAGGGTLDYRAWPEQFPDHIQVVAARLPGRETRMKERPLTSIRDMAELVLREHRDALAKGPWAIYGHSMGSWIGFELVRAARRRGLRPPTHLFAASRRAPHLPSNRPKVYHLPDDQLVQALQDRYNAIPEQLLKEPEVLAMFLPTLRADFTALDTYPYVPGPPLPCTVVALRGAQDRVVAAPTMEAWAQHGRDGFHSHTLPGGHFFLREDRELVCDRVCTALLQWARANR